MYLSFSSDILEQNQITDYLIRVVQPRLSAIERRAARRHPRRAHVRDARLAQARSDGGAQRQPGAGAAGARAPTTTCRPSGRPRARWSRSNLTAPTPTCTPSRSSSKLVIREQNGALVRLERHRRRRARRRGLRQDVRFSRQDRRCSWASGCCPTPTRSTSSSACAQRWTPSRRSCPPA